MFTQEEVDNYLKQGLWDNINPLDIWERNAERYPNDEALVDPKSRLTWSEVKVLSDRIAISFLKLGIKKGEVIVIQLPNWVELPILRLACEKAGIIPLLAGRALRSSEMRSIIRQVEAVGAVIPCRFRNFDYVNMIERIQPALPSLKHVFIVGDDVPKDKISIKDMTDQPLEKSYLPNYFEKSRIAPTEPCVIVHTSGTTGVPKLVARVGSRLGAAREAILRNKLTRKDIFGALAPAVAGTTLTHSYLTIPLLGVKCVMMEHFSVEDAFKLIEREKITVASVVPAQLSMMLNHPDLDSYDLRSCRCIISASAPLSYHMAAEFEERTGCHVVNVYGTMEAPSISTPRIDDPLDVRLLTVGKPYMGSEVRLVDDYGNDVPQGDVGQIMVRGPFPCASYYKTPEFKRKLRTPDRWIKLSDLGRFDEMGNLVIVGRVDYVVIRGGQNIYPAEIESLLAVHPKIQNVAVIGIPDSVMGHRCCACVVLKSGVMLTFEEVVAFLKNKGIAPYKIPERLEIIDKLPLTGGQKVDKKALRYDIVRKMQEEV